MNLKQKFSNLENYISSKNNQFLIGKSLDEENYKNPISIVIGQNPDGPLEYNIFIGNFEKNPSSNLILPFCLHRGREHYVKNELNNISNFPQVGEEKLFIYKQEIHNSSQHFLKISTLSDRIITTSYGKCGEHISFLEKDTIFSHDLDLSQRINLFSQLEEVITNPNEIDSIIDKDINTYQSQINRTKIILDNM